MVAEIEDGGLGRLAAVTRTDELSERLAAARPELSPKMAQVAAWLSEHYLRAAFMTTRELAEEIGVSLATVVRFPLAIGYPNFDALRAAIQDRVSYDLSGIERLRTLPNADRSASALLRRIINADIESLQALAHTFSESELERFVEVLAGARRVVVLGFRYMSPLATYFGYALGKILPDVSVVTQGDSTVYDQLQLMDERDVLVVVAFARYPSDLVAMARHAQRRGPRVLAITDTPLSPVLPLAEVALFARVGVLDFVGSLAAPAALINCVVTQVCLRLGDAALARLEELEDAAAEAGIYLRAGSSPPRFREQVISWRNGPEEPAGEGLEASGGR
jgi:DNA-binding MurR/RpiR family transcriptional regulator